MKSILAIAALVLLSFVADAQTLSNEVIDARIKSARAENNISLDFDAAGGSTKFMAVSENFSKGDADRSGILAMNFALGVIYPGSSLAKTPESFLLTFWVLSKKPRFGANHAMTVTVGDEMLVIGSARYSGNPREQMEYLNFEISRENLRKIASEANVEFQLGEQRFAFTKSQIRLIEEVLVVTEVR